MSGKLYHRVKKADGKWTWVSCKDLRILMMKVRDCDLCQSHGLEKTRSELL